MVVDEEFFMFVTTHPSARQYLILTILCTLLASTFSRKRRLYFEQFRTSGFVFKHPYKSKFEMREDGILPYNKIISYTVGEAISLPIFNKSYFILQRDVGDVDPNTNKTNSSTNQNLNK